MAENALFLKGTLEGHSNWVTSIATTDVDSSMIVSSSRGTCRAGFPSLRRLAAAARRLQPHATRTPACIRRAPAALQTRP